LFGEFCHAEYLEDVFQAETNSSKCMLRKVSVRVSISCIQYARSVLCI